MSEPTPNLPLLRKALSHIDAHPEEYDQRQWVTSTPCGTAHCVAGHVVNFAGALQWAGDPIEGVVVEMPGIGWWTVGEAAQDALGITLHERCQLFRSDNTREDVQRAAEGISARAGERL